MNLGSSREGTQFNPQQHLAEESVITEGLIWPEGTPSLNNKKVFSFDNNQ